jgi:hypothetical protein
MNSRSFIWGATRNPILQVLYLLAGGVVLIGAVVIGGLILAVVIGLALILAAVFWIRLWWIRRGMMRARADSRAPASVGRRRSGDAEAIEVEYTVIDERKSRRRDEH